METLLQTPTSALQVCLLPENMVELMNECVNTVDAELESNPEVMVYGRVCHQHRCVGFYSNTSFGYRYSGIVAESKHLHPCLEALLQYVNEAFQSEYNGILINKYVSGEDYIGKHSDNELGLGKNCEVLALSYGASRKFRIREKVSGKIVMDVKTVHNQFMLMSGDFQKEFTHEIPCEKKVKEVRYSFTFRYHTS